MFQLRKSLTQKCTWRRRLKILGLQRTSEAPFSTSKRVFSIIQVKLDDELEKKMTTNEIKACKQVLYL